MSTKNVKKENVEGTKVVEAARQEKTVALIPQKNLTPEEKNKLLEAEIAALRAKLSQEPQNLADKILYYEEKQKKINQLNGYEVTKKELEKHSEALELLKAEDDFECSGYVLSVGTKTSYNDIPVFKMNNPTVIGDVINFVLGKISEKMDVLKAEIAM